eukprot:XP_017945203.1 PREDICTED: uncharacterized protein LOC101731719 [Xenopus tropicalis]
MGFTPGDLSAVMAQSSIEFDVTFNLPDALDHFWRIYNIQSRAGHQNWDKLVVIPMTRPQTKNITVIMKNDAVPQEDILMWLRRQCTVLTPLVKAFDEDGVWAGVWKTQVKLNMSGNVPQHLPNSFFLGRERGVCFYVGQPRKCFKCGAGDHLAKSCEVLRCALCNAVGHEAESCNRIRCNLCNRMGHMHRKCPEAYHNVVKLFPEIDREMRREMVPPQEGDTGQEGAEVQGPQEEVVSKRSMTKGPKHDRRKEKRPDREVKRNPNNTGRKDNEGWEFQKSKAKNKNKRNADLLDPGESSSGVCSFSLSTKNKFSVLEEEPDSWGDRAEREEELERMRREEEREQEQMEIQLASQKRGRETEDQPVRKKGVGGAVTGDPGGGTVGLEDDVQVQSGPQAKRFGEATGQQAKKANLSIRVHDGANSN